MAADAVAGADHEPRRGARAPARRRRPPVGVEGTQRLADARLPARRGARRPAPPRRAPRARDRRPALRRGLPRPRDARGGPAGRRAPGRAEGGDGGEGVPRAADAGPGRGVGAVRRARARAAGGRARERLRRHALLPARPRDVAQPADRRAAEALAALAPRLGRRHQPQALRLPERGHGRARALRVRPRDAAARAAAARREGPALRRGDGADRAPRGVGRVHREAGHCRPRRHLRLPQGRQADEGRSPALDGAVHLRRRRREAEFRARRRRAREPVARAALGALRAPAPGRLLGSAVRRICAFSGKRGGFGAYVQLMRRIEDDPELELLILLGDQHGSEEFGSTVEEARATFPDSELELLEIGTGRGDSELVRAENLAACLAEAARVLERREPEVVVVHGDRGEHLMVAFAALNLGIAVAHTQGGDRSGNVDEIQRHAISKLAHLHFPETEAAAERLRRMGEDDWRIHVVGSTYVDRIVAGDYTPPEEARRALGLDPGEPFLLVLVHPETYRSREENARLAQAVLEGARATGLRSVVTY